MPLTKIDAYEVFYSSNNYHPKIALKAAGNYIAQAVFMPNGTALPQDGLVGGQPTLYYHLDDFHNVIDVLRNEKPVSLLYVGSGAGFENLLRTIK